MKGDRLPWVDERCWRFPAQASSWEVAAILTVIGGFNSNELIPHLDWDLIGDNPKVSCGFSDITALQNAILALST